MTDTIYETENKIRMVSNRQPKSLLLPIPATVRDLLSLQHGTQIKWCVKLENKKMKVYIEKMA